MVNPLKAARNKIQGRYFIPLVSIYGYDSEILAQASTLSMQRCNLFFLLALLLTYGHSDTDHRV